MLIKKPIKPPMKERRKWANFFGRKREGQIDSSIKKHIGKTVTIGSSAFTSFQAHYKFVRLKYVPAYQYSKLNSLERFEETLKKELGMRRTTRFDYFFSPREEKYHIKIIDDKGEVALRLVEVTNKEIDIFLTNSFDPID